MRLVQFNIKGSQKIGIEMNNGGDIVNLTDACDRMPNNMMDFLNGGSELLELAERMKNDEEIILPRKDVRLLSPITNPEKIICVGLNYRGHCLEHNVPIPTEPIIFSKFSSSIIGTGDAIRIPQIAKEIDWEVELVAVIGKRGKHISKSDALDYVVGYTIANDKSHALEYVVGYTIANDVNARDWMNRNGQQVLLGSSFDTFCPLGPAIVTKEALKDPHNLNLKCIVNGKTMQDGNTNQLIFKIDDIVEHVSRFFELTPGDIILTGTPSGTGMSQNPPVYLEDGDEVRCEIDGIGYISNPVKNEENHSV